MVLNVTNFPQHLTATSEIKHVIETITFSPTRYYQCCLLGKSYPINVFTLIEGRNLKERKELAISKYSKAKAGLFLSQFKPIPARWLHFPLDQKC